MNILSRLFGRQVRLDAADQARLDAWLSLADSDLAAKPETSRYVVVDVETTGLNLVKDRLIAIGACAVSGGRIDINDSFEAVLRQDRVSSKDNILIHGIGGEAQREGQAPVEALLSFLEFLGKSPLIAFHVTFDQTMIKKALKAYLGFEFKHPWLDMAYVMPGLMPEYARKYRALDEWSGHFEIGNYARHSALADALATAQLFLCALPLARARHAASFRDLANVEQAQRWVNWAT